MEAKAVQPQDFRSQSKKLDRKKFWNDPILIAMIVIMVIFLTLFIVYPLVMLLSEALRNAEGQFTLDTIKETLTYVTFKTAFFNTLKLGLIVGVTSTIVGMLFAYIDVYVKTKTKVLAGLFNVVATMPVVSPPFVLSLSLIMLFGRTGFITKNLLGLRTSALYGMPGLIIVQTLTFFPVCYLTFKGLLKNIDPSIEEAARDIGASRMKVFTSVTLPLMLPGIGNAFLVTFIESIADFANPMIIGGNYDTLATSIYLQITGALNKNVASAMALFLLLLTMALFLLQKYWLERKATATLTGKAARGRILIEDKGVRIPLSILAGAVSIFVIGLYVLIPIGSLFNLWGRDYSLTLKWYEYTFASGGAKQYTDSITLALIAAPITSLMSMLIAWMVVKKKFALKGYIAMITFSPVPSPILVRSFEPRKIECAFHDIDGTHSLIRNWPPVMSIVLDYAEKSGVPEGYDSPEQVKKIASLAGTKPLPVTDAFCVESAGLSALTQMEWALRRAVEAGTVRVPCDREENREKIRRIYGGEELFPDLPDSPELAAFLTEHTSFLRTSIINH